ncbi:MAG: hypothetical protein ABIP61_13305 [Burkholderiaceae bacterium]
MDVFAHALWAGAGVVLARRCWPIGNRTAALTVALAVAPDLPHLLPVVGWSLFGGGTLATVRSFAIAVPGQQAVVPQAVLSLSEHLHCIPHSAVIAAAVTLLLWWWRRALWIPLLGWWSHIVIDVFTHSADYYAVPVLYPFTMRGFDGLAWNTPWFMALNYVALAAAWLWLWRSSALRKQGA